MNQMTPFPGCELLAQRLPADFSDSSYIVRWLEADGQGEPWFGVGFKWESDAEEFADQLRIDTKTRGVIRSLIEILPCSKQEFEFDRVQEHDDELTHRAVSESWQM